MTTISYSLSEAGKVTLSISDIAGKVIYTQSNDAQKGDGQFSVEASDLNQSGIYYYTITSGHHSATRKMIFIK